MTAPITAQCGKVRLELHDVEAGLWDIHHGGDRIGSVQIGTVWVEGWIDPAYGDATAHTTSVEATAVRLAQLLNDEGFVPAGAVPL